MINNCEVLLQKWTLTHGWEFRLLLVFSRDNIDLAHFPFYVRTFPEIWRESDVTCSITVVVFKMLLLLLPHAGLCVYMSRFLVHLLALQYEQCYGSRSFFTLPVQEEILRGKWSSLEYGFDVWFALLIWRKGSSIFHLEFCELTLDVRL